MKRNEAPPEHVTPLPIRWADRWDQTRQWMALGMVFIPVGERLLAHYSEPGRHYHDARHILNCLDTLEKYPGNIHDNDAVELALWFHDSVYDPRAAKGENEAKSAELFRAEFQSLATGLVEIDEVARLIAATSHQKEPADGDAALIMDIDLSILAIDPPRYDSYAADIRKEYAHVDDEEFRKGRGDALRAFLGRKMLYWTQHFRKSLEERARGNMERELKRLMQG